MSIDEVDEKTKTWRDELPQLFGIRWDSFALWVLFGWASVWLWSSWIASNDVVLPASGPISWIAEMLRSLAIEPPEWILAIPEWLTDPARGWLLSVFVVMSAVFATLSVRGDFTGLRFLALLTMLFALEIDQSGWPLLWAVLIALAPALVALVWGIVHSIRHSEDTKYSYFYPWGVATEFLSISIGLYAFPIVAPLVLVVALIWSYRTEIPFKVHEELSAIALRELEAQKQAGSKPDQLTKFSLLAAIIAAPPSSRHRIADNFHYHLNRREEARRLQRKADNQMMRYRNGFLL